MKKKKRIGEPTRKNKPRAGMSSAKNKKRKVAV